MARKWYPPFRGCKNQTVWVNIASVVYVAKLASVGVRFAEVTLI